MTIDNQKNMNRRTFIKTTATGAGVIAVTAGGVLAAPGPPVMQNIAVEKIELPEAPIPEAEIQKSETADIVIVGGGTSGMAAALSAVEAGATVILLEKHTGARLDGSYYGFIGSRLQKALGFDIDPEEVIQQLMKYGGNKPDQRQVRMWACQGAEVIDWLMDMAAEAGMEVMIENAPFPPGVDWRDETYYREYPAGHLFMDRANEARQGSRRTVTDLLRENALEKGADIRYQVTAVQVIRNGERVEGIIAKDKNGDFTRFHAARAVILCAGDYGNNPEMMAKYCPWAADIAQKFNVYSPPLNQGEGHRMAMRIGAVMELAPHAPMDHIPGPMLPMGMDAFLRVNVDGERYENEDVPGQSMANALFRQPDWKCWQVFDAKWPDEVSRMGVGLAKVMRATDAVKEDLGGKIAAGMCLQADTIEELARKMKVPAARFKATIDRYNALARKGADLDYGKRADRLTTVEKPPFYAGSASPIFIVALGGLIVNPKLQPLDADRNVIPGLYLAGNMAGGFYANDYPTMIPGLSHGRALTTGYLSAKYAAAVKTS